MSKRDKKKKKKKKKKSSPQASAQVSLASSSPSSQSFDTSSHNESNQQTQNQSSSLSHSSDGSRRRLSDKDHSSTEPSPQAKPIFILFLILFFGIQMYAPIRYYLGEYPWDERFSWRMFSTVRTLKCTPQLWSQKEGQSRRMPLRLSREMHMVWVNLMKRGRLRVVQEFARSYCKDHSNTALYVSLSCPHPTPPHSPVSLIRPDVDVCTSTQTLDALSDLPSLSNQ